MPIFAEIRAVTIIYDDTLTKEVTIGGFFQMILERKTEIEVTI